MPGATLYVIPGSHPSMTARLMLARKGIDYRRVDLMPVISRTAVRVLGFPGNTVPALKVDGRRVQGSRQIARELERVVPEPALFPDDPARRAGVEEAERFGDEELQGPARRIVWWSLRRDRSPLRSFATGARLGIPIGVAVKAGAPIVAAAARLNEATDENVEADLGRLPALLDRIDGWIADGTLGAAEPNAADLQIATSVRLLMTLGDLRASLAARPTGELATRVVPDFPGEVPTVLPAEWLAPLRAGSPRAA